MKYFDEDVKNIAARFAEFGLSPTTARVYLFLVVYGPSPVRQIAQVVGIHRADIYSKIEELQEIGLVETQLNSPKIYTAIELREAIGILLQRQRDSLALLEKSSEELISGVTTLRTSLGQQIPIQERTENQRGQYKVITGRRRYYSETKILVRSSQKEILRIFSPGAAKRTFLSGLSEDLALARSRGIRIRMITQVKPRNRTYLRRLSKIVEMKYLEGVHLRFAVFDRSVAIISANPDDESSSLDAPQTFLFVRDVRFNIALESLFERLWNSAKREML